MKKTNLKKIFLDTEFTGLHQNTTLISIALVAETGEEFYAEFTDYDQSQVNPWIQENVLSKCFLQEGKNLFLLDKHHIKGNRNEIKTALLDWLNYFDVRKNPLGKTLPTFQIWADVPHWDWVLFCELFGGALNLPPQIHYIPLDIATLLNIRNIDPDKSRLALVLDIDKDQLPKNMNEHNALFDCKISKIVCDFYL
ncbi:MAG: 3'-5' exoribonuclease [bacterium]|nr:3'-5' exoribonuclease [bacterium]